MSKTRTAPWDYNRKPRPADDKHFARCLACGNPNAIKSVEHTCYRCGAVTLPAENIAKSLHAWHVRKIGMEYSDLDDLATQMQGGTNVLKEREREIYRIFAEDPLTGQAGVALLDELAEIIAALAPDGDTVIDDIGDRRHEADYCRTAGHPF